MLIQDIVDIKISASFSSPLILIKCDTTVIHNFFEILVQVKTCLTALN